jgi:hypothetical protein
MKYHEWVKKHGHLDRLVRGNMPTDKEVGTMTDDEIMEKFGHKIKEVADELGIDLDKNDFYEIIDRLYATPDMPKFHRSHYDLHC